MKARVILTIFAIAHALVSVAGVNTLKVKLKSGDDVVFALKDTPKYWNTSSSLVVEAAGATQEFSLSNVKEIAFDSSSTSVESLGSDEIQVYPTLASDEVFVKTPSNAVVKVYDAEGVVRNEFGLNNETKSLNVSNWAAGLYVIEINGQTFKILKR